jgi:c-di-GMP-binding flagellar brake protein YcgR
LTEALPEKIIIIMEKEADKRKFYRVDFITSGRLSAEGISETAAVINLSLKGALVTFEKDIKIPLNTALHFEIELINTIEKICVNCTAVHIDGKNLGLKFREIDPDSMIHLRRLIELNSIDPSKVEKELFFL